MKPDLPTPQRPEESKKMRKSMSFQDFETIKALQQQGRITVTQTSGVSFFGYVTYIY